jgi:hypothetical protein
MEGAAPQYRDWDSWHQDRDSHARFFERVRQDLDHVQSAPFSGADEYRIARTKQQLDELQSKAAESRYDQP